MSSIALPQTTLPSKISLSEFIFEEAAMFKQPHTTPITNLPSTPNPVSTGSLLALNAHYIVYAVKNGLIRVMDRSSANPLRTLLRSHTARITDCAFFGTDTSGKGGGSDILASVGGNSVVIWRIFSREDELSSEILLEIEWDPPADGANFMCKRVVWHPFNPNQFMLILNESNDDSCGRVAMFVETTRLLTVSKDGHALWKASSSNTTNREVDGILDLIVLDGEDGKGTEITDLSWSTLDSRHVLSSHEDGYVRLWDLKDSIYVMNGKEVSTVDVSSSTMYAVSARCIMSVKVSSLSSVQRCFFLSSFEDACSFFKSGGGTAMEPGSNMTSPFVTVTENGEVGLWSPFTMTGSPPNVVQIVDLESLSSSPVQAALCCQPHGKTEDDPPSAFLVVGDELGNLATLHLASQWRQVPSPDVTAQRKVAAVTGFNYMNMFKTLQPIYSWSVMYSIDDSSDTKQFNIDCYCVQSKAVQKLTLSPAMCAAPTPLSQGYVPDGITLVDINSVVSADEKSYADDDKIEFDDYDEVSEAEEEEEEARDRQSSVTTNSEDKVKGTDPHQPPPLPSFLTGKTNSGSFSNWLGNLAGKAKTSNSNVPPTPTVTPVATPITKPEQHILDLNKFPLPNIPESVDSIPSKSSSSSLLLSPSEILGTKPTDSENAIDSTVVKSKEKKPTKSEKKASSKSKSSQEPVAVAILKREDVSGASTVETPPTGAIGSVTKEEVEEIVRKAVGYHFQKQEAMIVSEIQKAVRYEVQSGLVPILNKTVSKQLEDTVSKTMKTQINKSVTECMSVQTEEIANTVTSSLREPIVGSFVATMREVIIPAYESGTRQMMEQISSSIETNLELNKKNDESTMKMMETMSTRMDAMGKTIEVLLKAVATLASNQNSASAAESIATTSNEDELKRIDQLIQSQDYEAAFTKALSASKPELAVYACKLSDLSTVIEGDTPLLSQPIMLCLMQQLGADLSQNEDLNVKINWLQSVAVTLDPNNDSIKKHVRGVCQQLVSNLQVKMIESDAGVRRQLQMLTQVIRGVGS
jgi:enhancer of mRNA-decapping protein 4